MRNASAAALAIMSGGKYLLAGLYDISLQNGNVLHFTDFDIPLKAAINPSSVINQYLTGLTITRGAVTNEVGMAVQELEVTISPQQNNPAGPVLFSGYPLQQAIRIGLLDNALVQYSELYMNYPGPGQPLDTSSKGVPWYSGNVGDIDPVGILTSVLKVASGQQYFTVQMPRNLYQGGCVHTLYDTGCTLSQAAFTATGTVSSVIVPGNFNTSLTAANRFYEMGVLKFTSGANAGFSSTVKAYAQASGNIQTVMPFPFPIQPGDAFNVYPGCDHTQATCISKFNNKAHFKGFPFVPVTETLYDGGTSQPTNAAPSGSQAGNIVGSKISGNIQRQ